jgi:hypothetical protein
VNLAIPLFVFSEPMPPIVNTDKAMDPILFCPVKAVPPSKFLILHRMVELDET